MDNIRPIDANKFEVIGGIIPDGYDADSYLAGCKEILDMIDNAPTLEWPKWISVEERVPERHGQQCVGLYNHSDVDKQTLFPYVFTWNAYGYNGYVNGPHFSDEGLDGLKVHYWMPLPEPPKE